MELEICKNIRRCLKIPPRVGIIGNQKQLEPANLYVKQIKVEATINELYSETQTFIEILNDSKNESIELTITFPLDKKSVMHKFEAKLGDKKIYSKILEKEKAMEKYADTVSSGNLGMLSTYSEEKSTFEVNFGNLQKGENIELAIFTIQINNTLDKSFMYSYTPACLPSFNRVPFGKFEGTDLTFQGTFIAKSPITRLISKFYSQNDLIMNFSQNLLTCDVNITPDILHKKNYADLIFLYRTENMSETSLFEEYDPKLKIYSYTMTFMLDKYNNVELKNLIPTIEGDKITNTDKKVEDLLGIMEFNKIETNNIFSDSDEVINIKECKKPQKKRVDLDNKKDYSSLFDKEIINDYPGTFIFLLDQSGSMAGKSLDIAKESLILFIRSLPPGSEFDIIGFGSSFNSYFSTIQTYNDKNVKNAIKIISGLKANMGGTNIMSPLKYIYNDSVSKGKNYRSDRVRNIFLLTDGRVENSDQCTGIVGFNNFDYKLSSIGIGKDVDKEFILKIGDSGRGVSHLVPDVDNLKSIVISALNSAMKPYMSEIKVSFLGEVNKLFEYPNLNNKFIVSQDEIFTYSFVSEKPLSPDEEITFWAYDPSLEQETIKKLKVSEKVNKVADGCSLNKIIVGLKLRYEAMDLNDEDIIKTSINFQVLSKLTALFAWAENDKSNTSELMKIKLESNINNSFNNTLPNKELKKTFINKNNERRSQKTSIGVLNPKPEKEYYNKDKAKKSSGVQYIPLSKSTTINPPSFNKGTKKSENEVLMNNTSSCSIPSKSPILGQSSKKSKNSILKDNCEAKKEKKLESEKKDNSRQRILVEEQCEEEDDLNCFNEEKNYESINLNNDSLPNFDSKKKDTETKNLKGSDIFSSLKSSNICSIDITLYNSIIDSQSSDGIWKNNSYIGYFTIVNMFKDKFNLIFEEIIKMNKKFDKISLEDCICTLMTIYGLNKLFPEKLNEFKLIANKANKFLLKNGIDSSVLLK